MRLRHSLAQLQRRARRCVFLVDMMRLCNDHLEIGPQRGHRLAHRTLQHSDSETHIAVVDDRYLRRRRIELPQLRVAEAADTTNQRRGMA